MALAPGLARTQMVLGFAALTRIEIDEAKAAFERAIELDSALPLARLGLGASIREGDLGGPPRARDRGRARPQRFAPAQLSRQGLFRGAPRPAGRRAVRDRQAARPNDPTPYFYDAIRLQTESRPVEALRELERSIALNDTARSTARACSTRTRGPAGQPCAYLQRPRLPASGSVRGDPEIPERGSGQLLGAPFSVRSYARPRRRDRAGQGVLQAQLLQPINSIPFSPAKVAVRSQRRSLGRARPSWVPTNSHRCSSATTRSSRRPGSLAIKIWAESDGLRPFG